MNFNINIKDIINNKLQMPPKLKKNTIVKNVEKSKNNIRKVKQINTREHIKSRSMWAGSKNSQLQEFYVLCESKDEYSEDINNIFESKELKFPPALYKIIDEIMVNAIDHYVSFPKQVTEIKISVSDNGIISVYNNGPGIHIEETKNIQGEIMYTPQLIFSEFYAGSNLDDIENSERIVGGQNGLGAKITAVFSDFFTVETCDVVSKKHYTQTFKDGLKIIEKPTIKKSKKSDKPFTRITFLPTYSDFKLDIKTFYQTIYK